MNFFEWPHGGSNTWITLQIIITGIRKHDFNDMKMCLCNIYTYTHTHTHIKFVNSVCFPAPSLDLISLLSHVVTCVAAAAADARTSPGAGETWGPAAGLCLSAPGLWLHSSHLCHTATKCCPPPSSTGACGGAEGKLFLFLFSSLTFFV